MKTNVSAYIQEALDVKDCELGEIYNGNHHYEDCDMNLELNCLKAQIKVDINALWQRYREIESYQTYAHIAHTCGHWVLANGLEEAEAHITLAAGPAHIKEFGYQICKFSRPVSEGGINKRVFNELIDCRNWSTNSTDSIPCNNSAESLLAHPVYNSIQACTIKEEDTLLHGRH